MVSPLPLAAKEVGRPRPEAAAPLPAGSWITVVRVPPKPTITSATSAPRTAAIRAVGSKVFSLICQAPVESVGAVAVEVVGAVAARRRLAKCRRALSELAKKRRRRCGPRQRLRLAGIHPPTVSTRTGAGPAG